MRRRSASALVVALLCSLVVGLAGAAPASAHPLGNFTVNRYARVEVAGDTVRVVYVLDLAEIPSFQIRDQLDADPERYAAEQADRIRAGLLLEVDGAPLEMRAVDRRLTRPAGQAGLRTTRLAVLYEAALPAGAADGVHDGRLRDDNDGERIGWREIVVAAPGDGAIVRSSVPATDVTDELREYPEDRLQSPLDVREATFAFRPGTEEVAPPSLETGATAARRSDRFTDLLDRQDLTPWALAGMLSVAVLVGAGHALAPGHGKTVMAAYLIGTRGRPVDAVLLGVIVSAMHTASVLLLGLVLHQVDERFALDSIYPVLTLVSGVGVLLVGLWLATTRTRALRGRAPTARPTAGHTHGDADHVHADHGHAHAEDDGDGHEHGHTHGASDHDHDHGHAHAEDDGDGHEHGHTHGASGHDHGHAHAEDDRDGHEHGHAHGASGHDHGHAPGRHDRDAHAHDHAHGHGDHDGHAHEGAAVGALGTGEAGDRPGASGRAASVVRAGAGSGHDHAIAVVPADRPGGGRGGYRRTGVDGHDHGHGHHHGPGGHSHDLPEGVAPLSKRGLVLLATAGGVVPSPSAVIVLVSAFTLGRAALGLALVAAFSLGLAATLTAVGLALVFGSRAVGDRVSGRLVRVFPVAGAVALLALGVVLTVQGVRGL